jgi:ATP/maltotriose-dependent transcriptional regulator MalT
MYALTVVYGPIPVDEGIRRSEEIAERVQRRPQAEAAMLCVIAQLEAMRYEFERARDLYTRARAMFEELDLRVDASTLCLSSAHVELLAGDAEAAERELRRGYDHLDALGERYLLSSIAGLLAEALVAAGRFAEAEDAALATEELADESDVDAQSLWRTTRAKILAQRGSLVEAEALAREAVELLAPTDGVVTKVSALADLARILVLAGRDEEARALIGEARRMAELKGSPVMVDRLDELAAEAAPTRRSSRTRSVHSCRPCRRRRCPSACSSGPGRGQADVRGSAQRSVSHMGRARRRGTAQPAVLSGHPSGRSVIVNVKKFAAENGEPDTSSESGMSSCVAKAGQSAHSDDAPGISWTDVSTP